MMTSGFEDDVHEEEDALTDTDSHQQLPTDTIDRQNNMNSPLLRFGYQIDSAVSSSYPEGVPVMMMMSKKARPDKYYLRFGKRSAPPSSFFASNDSFELHHHDKVSLDVPPTHPAAPSTSNSN
jgi:hypothetical protein